MPLPSNVWMERNGQRAEVRNNASVEIMERHGWQVVAQDAPETAQVGAPAAASAPEAVAVAGTPEAAPRAPTARAKGRRS